jgi:ribosomal protein L24E
MSMRKLQLRKSVIAVVLATAMSVLGVSAFSATPASAGGNVFPKFVVGGFPSASGNGFWLAFANGAVDHFGDAVFYGDAHLLPLQGPVRGGARVEPGNGYWLVASDGGIFSYGSARFFGSMGGTTLSQPVFSMASTKSGNGYWLVARDGGIFSFGDARFYGSTGAIKLVRPVVGLVAHASGKGYTMVASDGGVFDFGDNGYHGSLPGIGISVSDVVGLARTPSGRGYWIVRSGGQVYPFGNANRFRAYTAPPCDPVVGIIARPAGTVFHFQGYRLVLRSGATIAFGSGLDGKVTTGTPARCP